jgi:hypothetical protein
MSAVGILARDTPSPPQHATPAETKHATALKHESPVLKTTPCFSAQDYIRRRPSVFPSTHTHKQNAHARAHTHTDRRCLHILTLGGRNEDYCRCLAHKIGMRALDYARGRSAAPGNHVDAGGDVPLRATLCAAAGFYFALCHIITRSCVSDNLLAQTSRESERANERARDKTERAREREREEQEERVPGGSTWHPYKHRTEVQWYTVRPSSRGARAHSCPRLPPRNSSLYLQA